MAAPTVVSVGVWTCGTGIPVPAATVKPAKPFVGGPSAGEMLSANVRAEFKRLADEWREETGKLSNMRRRVQHASYRAIVRMGPEAIPLLLEELRDRPDWWFLALEEISGRLPVSFGPTHDFSSGRSAWLAWGRQRGYLA